MISVLCPTRNRPAELGRMVMSIAETVSDNRNVEVLLYIDNDDTKSAHALTAFVAGPSPIQVKWKIGPRIVVTKCWNELLPLASGDILMQGNDDIVFKTPGWDKLVEQVFEVDRIALAFGDDLGGYHEMKFGPHPFVHRRWAETLGYFTPPYFSSDFGDTWLNELGVAVEKVVRLPIQVEHMHFIFGKADRDQTTWDRLERHKKDDPGKVYEAMAPLRALDAKKLRKVAGLSDEAFAGYQTIVPKLDILILTQYSRASYLERLLEMLVPQVEATGGQVEIKIEMYERGFSLGENRERLRRRAMAEYICFVDDDDLVAKDYVAKILPLLDGVDYVGFKVQCTLDDKPLPVTRHSLRYPGWGGDDDGYYRDISHLNPMRRELALKVAMEGGFAEDNRWADEMRALKIVNTERYINEVMYHYFSRTSKTDGPRQELPPLVRRGPHSPQVEWRPTHYMCPRCQSTCVVPNSGGLLCNQCGHLFL